MTIDNYKLEKFLHSINFGVFLLSSIQGTNLPIKICFHQPSVLKKRMLNMLSNNHEQKPWIIVCDNDT